MRLFTVRSKILLVIWQAVVTLETVKAQYTYWLETDGRYLGYLNEYPDHWTQGECLDDLRASLRDLYEIFTDRELPGIKKVAELDIA